MDSIVLYGPGGASPLQLGSYLQADPGPDYGEKGHIEPHFAETPALPGGQTLYSQTHIRKMTFPLMVASGGVVGLGLRQLESLIRANAVQGGYVDVQPFSVPSSEAVRFDILAGQWEPAFNIRINELGRMQGNLMLQTQPYGYWPTWITLGSSPSIGAPGFLPVSGGSVFGDAPGFGEVILSPSAIGSAFAYASMMPDALLWSVRSNPSFSPFLSPASWVADASSLFFVAAATGPAGATAFGLVAPGSAGWIPLAHYTIPAALEPAYRGRYQGFALVSGSAGYSLANAPYGAGWMLSLDTVADANSGAPLGSAVPVASFPGVALVASQALQMLALGPVVLPPAASGLSQSVRLRLWGNTPSVPLGSLVLGGLYLMSIDAPGGALRRGLTIPTVAAGSVGRLALDSYERSAIIAAPTGTLDQRLPVGAAVEYRGGLPVVGSSFQGLNVLALARIGGYGWGYRQEVLSDAPDHFYAFAASSFPTMIDQIGGLAGSWGALANTLTQATTGLRIGADEGSINVNGSQSQPTGQGWLPVGSADVSVRIGKSIVQQLQLYWASQWSVEFWMQSQRFAVVVGSIPATGSGVILANGAGPSVATDSGWFINWNVLENATVGSTGIIFDLGGDALAAMGASIGYPYHVVAQWFSPSKTMSLYVNGTLAASKTAAGSYKASAAGTGISVLGWNKSGGGGGYVGNFDALAIYPTVISASRIAAHYAAGAQGILSQATDNLYYAPIQVQAATRFRPAFAFMKGL